jgi:hypothetical protein
MRQAAGAAGGTSGAGTPADAWALLSTDEPVNAAAAARPASYRVLSAVNESVRATDSLLPLCCLGRGHAANTLTRG